MTLDLDSDRELDLSDLPEEIFIKILVLGDLGVGKTSLVRKYAADDEGARSGSGGRGRDSCSPDYKVSVDTGYTLKRLTMDGGKKIVNVQLWDIPGHERFGGMTRIFYRYAHGAFIVFDLARPDTFEAALSWLTDVTQKLFDEKEFGTQNLSASLPSDQAVDTSNKELPIILLANKCDLPDLKVPRHKYSSYVQENGLLSWFETSSRNEASMELAMQRLVEYILKTDPMFVSDTPQTENK